MSKDKRHEFYEEFGIIPIKVYEAIPPLSNEAAKKFIHSGGRGGGKTELLWRRLREAQVTSRKGVAVSKNDGAKWKWIPNSLPRELTAFEKALSEELFGRGSHVSSEEVLGRVDRRRREAQKQDEK